MRKLFVILFIALQLQFQVDAQQHRIYMKRVSQGKEGYPRPDNIVLTQQADTAFVRLVEGGTEPTDGMAPRFRTHHYRLKRNIPNGLYYLYIDSVFIHAATIFNGTYAGATWKPVFDDYGRLERFVSISYSRPQFRIERDYSHDEKRLLQYERENGVMSGHVDGAVKTYTFPKRELVEYEWYDNGLNPVLIRYDKGKLFHIQIGVEEASTNLYFNIHNGQLINISDAGGRIQGSWSLLNGRLQGKCFLQAGNKILEVHFNSGKIASWNLREDKFNEELAVYQSGIDDE